MAIPEARPLLLGIDIGTSRTKALLLDGTGSQVATAATATPFAAAPAGVEAAVEDLLAAVAEVLAQLGGSLHRVAAVGIAGLAESGTPVGGTGRPLAPVIAWHDRRGAEAVALLEECVDGDLSLRIGQRLRTVSSVAKLGWLVAQGVTGMHRWLGVPELCFHALTGAMATDFSLAARTGAYDVALKTPISEVPLALGLPADVFLAPRPAGTVMGRVAPSGSAWSGLVVGVPVTVAGHDHLAGMAGAGAGDGDLVNSVGTAETVLGRSDTVPDLRAALGRRAAVSLWPTGSGWVVLAGAARAGLVLDAAVRALGLPLAELDDLAESAPTVDASAWVDGLIEAAANWSAEQDRGGLVALTRTRQRPDGPAGAVWNGILAALADRTWDAARRVQDVAGPAQRLIVVGGGGRSRPWLRAKSASGHLPVARSVAGEAAARGAAVFAGVAAGWWPSAGAAPRPALEPVPPDRPG